jgi:hypothetical protein
MPTDREIIRSTAGFVATALGTGWSVDTESELSWGEKLRGPDGLSLLLDMSNLDRLEISGYMPRDPNGGKFHDTRIGVSRSRGPEVIAREINKRLLPIYRAQLAHARSVLAGREAAHARRKDRAHELADMFVDATVREGVGRYYVEFTTAGGESGEIDVYSEDKATFNMHAASPGTLRTIAIAIGGA